VLTGGNPVSEELGHKFENLTLQDSRQGQAHPHRQDNTTIIDGSGKKAEIEGRIS